MTDTSLHSDRQMLHRRAMLRRCAALASAALTSGCGGPRLTPDELRQLGRTPHTKFAPCIEMWWTKLPLEERIAKTAELGFPAFEFWFLTGRKVDDIARAAQQHGVAVAQFAAWGFEPGLNDTRDHDAFLRAVEQACHAAQRLDTRLLTVVGGDDRPGLSQRQMHDNIAAGLRRAAPIAAEHDCTLILEPLNIQVDHPGHCLYGSQAALDICRQVDSPHVKLNWDLYHMYLSEGNLIERLRQGFDYVGYLQLADHPGRHEPGTGEIDYRPVLQAALELGYDGYVGVECRPVRSEVAAAQAVAKLDRW